MKGQFACLSGNAACIAGSYDCGACRKEMHRRIWLTMSPERRAYDRMVDPQGAYTSGYSAGADPCCTCHISPPCGYCVSRPDPDARTWECDKCGERYTGNTCACGEVFAVGAGEAGGG